MPTRTKENIEEIYISLLEGFKKIFNGTMKLKLDHKEENILWTGYLQVRCKYPNEAKQKNFFLQMISTVYRDYNKKEGVYNHLLQTKAKSPAEAKKQTDKEMIKRINACLTDHSIKKDSPKLCDKTAKDIAEELFANHNTYLSDIEWKTRYKNLNNNYLNHNKNTNNLPYAEIFKKGIHRLNTEVYKGGIWNAERAISQMNIKYKVQSMLLGLESYFTPTVSTTPETTTTSTTPETTTTSTTPETTTTSTTPETTTTTSTTPETTTTSTTPETTTTSTTPETTTTSTTPETTTTSTTPEISKFDPDLGYNNALRLLNTTPDKPWKHKYYNLIKEFDDKHKGQTEKSRKQLYNEIFKDGIEAYNNNHPNNQLTNGAQIKDLSFRNLMKLMCYGIQHQDQDKMIECELPIVKSKNTTQSRTIGFTASTGTNIIPTVPAIGNSNNISPLNGLIVLILPIALALLYCYSCFLPKSRNSKQARDTQIESQSLNDNLTNHYTQQYTEQQKDDTMLVEDYSIQRPKLKATSRFYQSFITALSLIRAQVQSSCERPRTETPPASESIFFITPNDLSKQEQKNLKKKWGKKREKTVELGLYDIKRQKRRGQEKNKIIDNYDTEYRQQEKNTEQSKQAQKMITQQTHNIYTEESIPIVTFEETTIVEDSEGNKITTTKKVTTTGYTTRGNADNLHAGIYLEQNNKKPQTTIVEIPKDDSKFAGIYLG